MSDKLLITAREVRSSNGLSRNPHIAVTNPSHFDISVGNKVTIGFSHNFESFTGVLALLMPIISCAAGILLAPKIISILDLPFNNTTQYLIASLFFITTTVIVKYIERHINTVITPIITSVI